MVQAGEIRLFKTTGGQVELICPVPGENAIWVVKWVSIFHEMPYAVMKLDWLTQPITVSKSTRHED